MGNTLKLRKMGMDFLKSDNSVKDSDVGNYRVRTTGYEVVGRDGRKFFMEFTRSINKYWYGVLAADILQKRLPYTKAGILEAVNMVAKVPYDGIEIVD